MEGVDCARSLGRGATGACALAIGGSQRCDRFVAEGLARLFEDEGERQLNRESRRVTYDGKANEEEGGATELQESRGAAATISRFPRKRDCEEDAAHDGIRVWTRGVPSDARVRMEKRGFRWHLRRLSCRATTEARSRN